MELNKSKLIGVGTFGCVYRPPLCRSNLDSPTQDLVGKIAFPYTIEREINIGNAIRNSIPDWSQYYGLLTGHQCQFEITDTLKSECAVFKKTTPDKHKLIRSYSSPYLGTSLFYYKNPITGSWLWNSTVHLIKGLAELHKNRIYHLDISSANILIDNTGTCRLIDFGASIMDPTPEIMEDRKYGFFDKNPLFYNVYETQNDFGLDFDYDIYSNNKLLNTYYKNYNTRSKFFDPHYEKDTASDVIKNYINLGSQRKYLENIVIPNLGKIDLYRLGNTIDEFYGYHPNKPQIRETAPHLRTLLNGMIQVDLNSQWDMDRCLEFINSHNVQ